MLNIFLFLSILFLASDIPYRPSVTVTLCESIVKFVLNIAASHATEDDTQKSVTAVEHSSFSLINAIISEIVHRYRNLYLPSILILLSLTFIFYS
jgi:hypothetical protein